MIPGQDWSLKTIGFSLPLKGKTFFNSHQCNLGFVVEPTFFELEELDISQMTGYLSLYTYYTKVYSSETENHIVVEHI